MERKVMRNSHNEGECWNPDKVVFVKNLFLPTTGNLFKVLLEARAKVAQMMPEN